MSLVIDADRMVLHYRFVEKLGEGAMGQVWKAIDTTLDREVAIKVLRIAATPDSERLARFEREARLLARLTHPGIARVYSLHHVRNLSLLAMELDSPTLASASVTVQGTILGTAACMSPEQAQGQSVDHRSRHQGLRMRALRDADRPAGVQRTGS